MRTAILCLALAAVAGAASATKPIPSTVQILGPQHSREACERIVKKEEGPQIRDQVLDVELRPSGSDNVLNCLVTVKRSTGPGVSQRGEAIETADEHFDVSLDLLNGKETVYKVNVELASTIARAALAAMFIDLKPIRLAGTDITYSATIGGKRCEIEMAIEGPREKAAWSAKRIDCPR